MKSFRIVFVTIISAGLVWACATVSNLSVTNMNNGETAQAGSFVYSLPVTVIDVSVQAEEIIINPGPYARFAQKYLGIKDAPMKNEKIFNIRSVSIGNHLEADPDFIYSLSGLENPYSFTQISNLLKDSLILSVPRFSANVNKSYSYPGNQGDVLFKDLSIRRNFEAEKDVDVSTVMPDSGARPQTRITMKEKTVEQKAEEAADFLIKLKKRRFKLVAGQYTYMPNGEAMASALAELSRLEQEYLSLFTGKKTVIPMSRTFYYMPDPGKTSDRPVLFRFSQTEGFLDSRETAGIPVILELEASHKLKEMESFKITSKIQPNTIPYRIPDQARIRLMAGEQLWAEAISPVYQYGVPVSLTVNR
ncbi:MAG TPA: DUF4831 family protein [Bacteroidales bacterium]|nr:DUF4831 family protein [Bacteroidales bacterium]